MFECYTVDRRFKFFFDVGRSVDLEDSIILEQPSLKKYIYDFLWLGNNVSFLNITDVEVRPYLMGNSAIPLTVNVMKNTLEED